MTKIKKKIETRKFKIGNRVLYENSEHVIVAYNSNSRNTYAIYKISGGYSHYASEEKLTLIEEKMEKGIIKLTLEQAKELYNQGGNFKTIALGAYSEEELTKPTLPNTWEEFCKNYPRCVGESWLSSGSTIDTLRKLDVGNRDVEDDKNLLPNRKMVEAMLALCQLIQLRDCYNQGWKPDWSNRNENKYVIYCSCNTYHIDTIQYYHCIMAFETSELRDKFFDNFKDLLETAKELL